jgi:polysaccharide deacetylase 2 family uncharacterized protein YibQ
LPALAAGRNTEVSRTADEKSYKIAVIIDDIGYSYGRAKLFLDIDLPLTFSVLPQLPRSPHLSRIIRECGREVMIHQPMEPFNINLDPGPGALFVEDSKDRIARIMDQNLSANRHAAGVNNHMGSRFTSCTNKITSALEVIQSQNLYFIDSVTSQRSVAHRIARDMGLPTGYNRYFLDPVVREAFIYSRLVKLENAARRAGSAIGIGHPHPQTARALARFASTRHTPGLSWVNISDFLSPPAFREKRPSKNNSHWFYKTAI